MRVTSDNICIWNLIILMFGFYFFSSLVGIIANMLRHVVTTYCLLPFLANMGDTQISWLNEFCLPHFTSCCMSSSTLVGDLFCCLFLLRVLMQQKSMLMWCHICHVDNIKQNVACCWRCCCPACYCDIQQFQLSSPLLTIFYCFKAFPKQVCIAHFMCLCPFGLMENIQTGNMSGQPDLLCHSFSCPPVKSPTKIYTMRSN